jgi:hypothetical protein
MNKFKIGVFIFFILSLSWIHVHGATTQKINKTFESKKSIRVKTIVGNCMVKMGDNNNIHVSIEYSYPQKNYKPKIKEKKNKLVLKEKFKGSSPGESTWFLTVPENTEIVFTSVSGSFSVREMKGKVSGKITDGGFKIDNFTGELNLDTKNGDISIKNARGNFKINTYLGNINMDNVQGCFTITTYKGDLQADKVELHGRTKFTTYNGKAEVILFKSAEVPLSVTSGLGDVILNYNGNPLKGHFEMIRRASYGKIESPIPFENEEEFLDKGGVKFLKKSFTKKEKSPQILIIAHHGNAILKER